MDPVGAPESHRGRCDRGRRPGHGRSRAAAAARDRCRAAGGGAGAHGVVVDAAAARKAARDELYRATPDAIALRMMNGG